MDTSPPKGFPVSFYPAGNDASPKQFLDFLYSLIAENFENDVSIRIPVSKRETWAAVIIALSDNFLTCLPTPDVVLWNSLHEKVKLAEVTLELIERATDRVDGLHTGPNDVPKSIIARLLSFCSCLNVWTFAEIQEQEGILYPTALRRKSFEVAVKVLHCLGENAICADKSRLPIWKGFKDIVRDCLDFSQDLLNIAFQPTFPLSVRFFEKPQSTKISQEDSSAITLENLSHLAEIICMLADLLSRVTSSLAFYCFFADLSRQSAECLRAGFDLFISSTEFLTSAHQARALAQISSSACHLLSHSAMFHGILQCIPYRLLKYRLEQGAAALGYGELDAILHKFFRVVACSQPVKANIIDILDTLERQAPVTDVEDNWALVSSYLSTRLAALDIETLQSARKVFSINATTEAGKLLLKQIDQQLLLKGPLGDARDSNACDEAWRLQVRTAVREIIDPDDITWMEDDIVLGKAEYAQRALEDIKNRFERPLYQTSGSARCDLADKLGKLSCLLAHFDDSRCVAQAKDLNVIILPSFTTVIERLLDGDDNEVTPIIRRRVYVVLNRLIRHHGTSSSLEDYDYVGRLVVSATLDGDRSVRLGSGRALVALVRLYAHHLQFNRVEPFLDHMYRVLETGKDIVKESTLVTLGLLGCSNDTEIIGRAICCLAVQLGKHNPVLRGLAYIQLLEVASYHKKSPKTLLSPYLYKLAPYIVSRMCLQPILLPEYCRLIAVSPADFLSSTLQHTLPPLFANCDQKVLEQISKSLSRTIDTLFLNHVCESLIYIFLLQGPAQTAKATTFILKLLNDATHKEADGVIDLQSIVRGWIVPILVELVVAMGDEDETKAGMAVQALGKVERALSVPDKGEKSISSQNLGEFLKKYMLGVITDIINRLHDAPRRSSTPVKRQTLRGLGALISHIGPAVTNVAPQIMATFQTMVVIPELAEVTLQSWHTFLSTLHPNELVPHVAPTTASFASLWGDFSAVARSTSKRSLTYLADDLGKDLPDLLDEFVDMSAIPDLHEIHKRLKKARAAWTPRFKLERILERCSSDNLTLAAQSLRELKALMIKECKNCIKDLASGDMFDPLIGNTLKTLFAIACRDGEGTEVLHLPVFECISILGAVDPDRCDISFSEPRMFVISSTTEEEEAMNFALHLITDLLVGAYRSTSDTRYQSHLAYSIQELLGFCKFTPALVGAGRTAPVAIKVRNRWTGLPKHVLETVTPLLEGRLSTSHKPIPALNHPIYSHQPTYREWIQQWTSHLISKASGQSAQKIFRVFHIVVLDKDVGVAHYLLPHLVLNILVSGEEADAENIRSELVMVLEDQVNAESTSSPDKKLLSAQAVFMLLDHLNKWVRIVRQDLNNAKVETKRSRANQINNSAEEQLLRVDSILSSINQELMAKAALQCKSYARALMNFERHIVTLRDQSGKPAIDAQYYERLHEIYANLDEPDGMEGISASILSPSLEHQIRQHESTGRWTSAQSCWEVRLQQDPDNLDFHVGLLRCLRNLGHYDTLRTHVRGVLTRNPGWETALAGFQVESAWMIGAWDDVQDIVDRTNAQTAQIVMARLFLAMRNDDTTVSNALSVARLVLGSNIIASGVKGYRRSYEAVLNLHVTHEMEIIRQTMTRLKTSSQRDERNKRHISLSDLSLVLFSRLDATLPTFRAREAILSMRRTAFALLSSSQCAVVDEIGSSWLASAKIARKAGQWQTAYSAILQAKQNGARFSFMESAKLVKKTGEHLQALQELENSMQRLGLLDNQTDSDVIDLTEDDDMRKMKAKAQVLRARWMNESERFEYTTILRAFQSAADLCMKWESGHYHLGQYHDECFKNVPLADRKNRGTKMNLYTVKFFARAIKFGSKYVYQTIPRLLTIWLDMGEDRHLSTGEVFKRLNESIAKAIRETPVYKWYTAFPQIVSRVGHENADVYSVLSRLIETVLTEYPNQALWLFTSVVKSTKNQRAYRGNNILSKLRSNPTNARTQVPVLINQCLSMTNELLALCDHHIDDESKKTLHMRKDFPRLAILGRSPLIIPLQESLTATLPPNSSSESTHQPFPSSAPTFTEFFDEIEVMRSLARPRKITIRGSDGQVYMFLGKPKDDLRKDARLMDFNAIINKLLKANSESRRRQLHIRTYGVVTLNEECGLIQWVPNTIPLRPVLVKAYNARKIQSWSGEMGDVFKAIKHASEKDAAEKFVTKILPTFPPVFHDWFIETFPEPSAWLASRLAFSRTAAVMSMVGFILGLGDRHCENILLDSNTGDIVHVDFNCLFEKGKTLETPERVPFRLTQNMVDGLGVTGVEGVFRKACEVTMQLLRNHKDSLMSVLDAFVHDPLVEWEDEKRKLEREPSRRNQVKASVDLRMLAKNALHPIEKKLKGLYSTNKERQGQQISTSNLVQMLIQEATDSANLAKMYPGWAAWH